MLFGVIGTAAFAVDVGILYLLKPLLGVYWGRAASFFCAVFFTWMLNRHVTFKDRVSSLSLMSEFVRYFIAMLGGGCVNYGLYLFLVMTFEKVAMQPVYGVAVGGCAGLIVNFLSSRLFVFKGSSQKGLLVGARQANNRLKQSSN